MNYVKIKGQEYPVIYSANAVYWFADWLGIPTSEVGEVLESGMTERKGMALMYSGIVAGAEASQKRLDLSFYEFQEWMTFGQGSEEVAETLGSLFQKQMEVFATKVQSKVASSTKKKPTQKAKA